MGFFDSTENVRQYIQMCEGYDPLPLIRRFQKAVPKGSKVLELGMGPGTDLAILAKDYRVTGSDNSQVFLDLFGEKSPETPLLRLDAVSINTDLKFDAIYSNKVLHHLTTEDLKKSLARQAQILQDQGVVFHSFWQGTKSETIQDLMFIRYQKTDLTTLFDLFFDILQIESYQEEKHADSLLVIAQKKSL